jgi:hypothetical protein
MALDALNEGCDVLVIRHDYEGRKKQRKEENENLKCM